MKNRILIAFASALLLAPLMASFPGNSKGPDNKLTKKQKAEGWELLFDGQSLDGWFIRSGFATYEVEEGAIVGTTKKGSPNTFLCSGREFSDFELTFEVRFDEVRFNSGVQIRSKLRKADHGGRVYGPQVEIEESPGQAGFIYGEAAGGWQSQEPKSEDPDINSHSHFKNEGWNHYRILAVGRSIQTWINGKKVADINYDEGRYMDNPEGFIGLQVHRVNDRIKNASVRWKNIYIREIPDSDPASVALFNGKDFEGWKFHLGEEGADNDGTFTVSGGMIHCTGQPRGYIYTAKTFSNYIIKYDTKFVRPADLVDDSQFKKNSGCLIHAQESTEPGLWPMSIEVQGKYNEPGRILPIPRSVPCEITYDQELSVSTINPVGEWSTVTVDVQEGDMLIRLNGIQVSTVKNAALTSGHIGLQSEGGALKWKNIKILER